MNNAECITVVIPVYNVADYLDECVESVTAQTCTNLEIILVDDGSTDASGKMCDLWQERDSRIRVIHKHNGGLSDARNTGLRAAKGKYISFIDSDDLVAPTFLECLYTAISLGSGQISCCGCSMFEDGQKIPKAYLSSAAAQVLDSRRFIEMLHLGQYPQIGVMAWNKLYSVDLFRSTGIAYPKGKIYEDTFTTFRLLYHTQDVAVSDSRLYYYRRRSGSITGKKIGIKKCRDGIEADYSNVAFFKEKQEWKLAEQALNAFFRSTIRTYREVSSYQKTEERDACRQMLTTAFRRVWREDRALCHYPTLQKAAYGLFAIFPDGAARLIP